MRCNNCGKLQVYCNCEVPIREVKSTMHIVKHIKTGKIYYIIHEEVLIASHKLCDLTGMLVVYMDFQGTLFGMGYHEFWKKFCSLSDRELGSLKIIME